eukprot:m51a1_g7294 putative serine threonine protein kinase (571) ;mRNA; f:61392-64072
MAADGNTATATCGICGKAVTRGDPDHVAFIFTGTPLAPGPESPKSDTRHSVSGLDVSAPPSPSLIRGRSYSVSLLQSVVGEDDRSGPTEAPMGGHQRSGSFSFTHTPQVVFSPKGRRRTPLLQLGAHGGGRPESPSSSDGELSSPDMRVSTPSPKASPRWGLTPRRIGNLLKGIKGSSSSSSSTHAQPEGAADEKKSPKSPQEQARSEELSRSLVLLPASDVALAGEAIGEGAAASVHRGLCRGQEVAVKVIRSPEFLTEEERTDLLREVLNLQEARNPHIVSFVGMVQEQSKLWIVTEFIRGGTLKAALARGPLDLGVKLRVALDVAQGLSFLHSKGILHRDLKSENLLVVSLDVGPDLLSTVKLIDFGASRKVTTKGWRFYTKGIGTPIYMSPEVITGGKYTLSTDVYSYGVLLWEIMAQREPFGEIPGGNWKVAEWVSEGRRLAMPHGTPVDVVELIQSCWGQNPETRPTMAKEALQMDTEKIAALMIQHLRSWFDPTATTLQGQQQSGPRPFVECLVLFACSMLAVVRAFGDLSKSHVITNAGQLRQMIVGLKPIQQVRRARLGGG